MKALDEYVKGYYKASLKNFEYTSPISGIATIISANRCYNQFIHSHDGKIYFGYIELARRNEHEIKHS